MIKDELTYWLEVIGDQQKTLDDLNSINESVDPLLSAATTLIALSLNDSRLVSVADQIMRGVGGIQDKLVASINRSEQTCQLIEGRMKMIKDQL